MLTLLLSTVLPAFYLAGVAVSTRVIYTRRYVEWMRWKNENPEEVMSFTDSWDEYAPWRVIKTKRKDTELARYVSEVSHKMSCWYSWLWPAMGPYHLVRKFCFPEVKVPDVARIKELEKL